MVFKKNNTARRIVLLSLLVCFVQVVSCCSGDSQKPDASTDSGTDSGLNCEEVVASRLLSPLSTKMLSSSSPTLRWEGDASTEYVVELSSTYSFEDVDYSWSGQETEHEVAQELVQGAHYWRVYVDGCLEETATPVWELFSGMTPHDVNGDGYSDILITALGQTDVRLVFGSPTSSGALLAEDADVVFSSGSEMVGESSSTSGDLDGDGISDIAIGASGMCPRGSVFLCSGRETWNANIDLLGSSCSRIDNLDDATCVGFGDGLSAKQDIDLDGFFDFIGSYPTDSAFEQYSGTAWMFLSGQGDILSRTTTDDADVRVMGFHYWQGLSSDSFAQDMNGDGFPELVLTSGRSPLVGVDWIGEAYLLLGEKDLLADYTTEDLDVKFSAEGEDVGFWAGDALGDFNGDGYGDVALGYRAGPGEYWITVVAGQKEMPSEVGFDSSSVLTRIQHPGGASADGHLIGILGPGDLNSDGLDDLVYTLYGSYSALPAAYDPLGAVYVVYGRENPQDELSADVVILGNGDPWFAYSWGPAGDVNGDGYADFTVSATGDGVNDSDEFPGRVFVFFGGPTLEDKETADDADLIISSSTPNESFGFCVNEDRGF